MRPDFRPDPSLDDVIRRAQRARGIAGPGTGHGERRGSGCFWTGAVVLLVAVGVGWLFLGSHPAQSGASASALRPASSAAQLNPAPTPTAAAWAPPGPRSPSAAPTEQARAGDRLPAGGTAQAAPSDVTLGPGDIWRPPGNWSWVCSGDVDVRESDGSVVRLYDEDPTTGLVVLIPAQTEAAVGIISRFGAHCIPATDTTLEARLKQKQAAMAAPPNCVGMGCRSVHLVRLDEEGRMTRDAWVSR